MKKLSQKSFIIGAVLLLLSPMHSETDIDKIYGEKTWCDTRFLSKNSYILAPDGSSVKSKNTVLTAIQKRLVQGKYKNHGCR